MSVIEAAKVLKVSCSVLGDLVSKRAGISSKMAIRLAEAIGGSPQVWIDMQAAYDDAL